MSWRCTLPLLLVTTSCVDGGAPENAHLQQIEAIGATQFEATALDTIHQVLVARVMDLWGRPVPGVSVTWTTPDGGVLLPVSATTDSEGLASATWILGWHVGSQHAMAMAGNALHPAVFTALAVGFEAAALSTGDASHQCAIASDGSPYCWGPNPDGQLGDGTITASDVPVRVQLTPRIMQVVTGTSPRGHDFTCALTTAGEVYCWGGNDVGQLGIGSLAPSRLPMPVSLPAGPYKALSTAWGGTCAISTGGDAFCWGWNWAGRFGAGRTSDTLPVPVPVLGGFQWQQLALGDDRSCGLRQGGQVYCWGHQPDWLGTGVDTNTAIPLPVVQAPQMDSLTISNFHQCGTTSTHETYCWGLNHNLGIDGLSLNAVYSRPQLLAVPPAIVSIHSVGKPTFGLGLDGKGYWWGPPNGATGGPPYTPEEFSGDVSLIAIGTSASGVCGIERDSKVVICWRSFDSRGPSEMIAVPPP